MKDYSLIYNRKKVIGKDGKALIQIRVYCRQFKKYKFLSSGIKVAPNQWDCNKQKVSSNHAQYISINRILNTKVEELQNHELSLLEQGKECTLEMLEQFSLNGKFRISFNQFVEYEINNSVFKKGTILQQKVFLNKLNEFDSNVSFSQINYDFCCRFEKFLQDKNLNPNSIYKEFKNFKKFVNLAINKDHIDMRKNPFPKYKIKTIPVKKTFLTDEEVNRIENLDLSDDLELDTVRDIYLFGVYSGLRFSDIISLRKEDIIKLEDGSWNLDIRMQKTQGLISLPLHKLFEGKPRDLLIKHDNLNPNNSKSFRSYSNQHVNRILKVIAKMAGISKRLTFHSSRHSFATILLNRGINIQIIQGLMGHGRLQQTEEYAKLLNTSVIRELDKVW